MPAAPATYFVFVDFENVSDIDLGLAENRAVHVTLLIGKNQKKLDLSLVQQIHRQSAQVELVEVGASGRNALDLTLAYYLGRAVQRVPDAQYFIVSKDKDFEPTMMHLRAAHVQVSRHDKFSALPFLPQPKTVTPARIIAPAERKAPEDRFTKLIEDFKKGPAHRPKKRATLLHHISTLHGNKLSEAELTAIVTGLETQGIAHIDAKGKVSYTAAP